MRFGNSAAFLCITQLGAMPSMPWRKEVDAFIAKYFPNSWTNYNDYAFLIINQIIKNFKTIDKIKYYKYFL